MRRRVRWHDRRNGSSSDSALRLVRTSSARLRRNRWTGSSNESGTSREGPRASASRRQWKSCPRICGAGAAISAFAKRPRCWSPSLAGSGCDCGLPSGANGKHHGVGERHSSHWESGGSCATWPAVAMDPGISPGAKPSPWDSPMPTSNRSVSHPCSARVSATSRTAVYGPVRTVVWEGRSREAPPYPDPVLYEVFRALGVAEDVRMQLCVGTSLAIIVPTTFRSYFTHRAAGVGLPDVVRAWTLPAIVGVATGAALAAIAPAALFKIAFAVIAGAIAAKLLFGSPTWRLDNDLPRGPAMPLFGYLIGLCSS